MQIATELSTQGTAEHSRLRKRAASSPPETSFAQGPAQRPKHTDAISTPTSHAQSSPPTKALSYLSYLDLAKDPAALTPNSAKYFAQQRDIVGSQRQYTKSKALADYGQGSPEETKQIIDTLTKPVTEHTQEYAGKTATNLAVALWRSRIPLEHADTAANLLAKIAHPATRDHSPAWQSEVADRLGTALWWNARGLKSTTKNRLVDTVFQRANGSWKSPQKQSEVLQFAALAAIEGVHGPEFSEHVTTESLKTLQALEQDESKTAGQARLAIAMGLNKMLNKGAVPSPALQEKAIAALWDLSEHPANSTEQTQTYRTLARQQTYTTSEPIQDFLNNGKTKLLHLIDKCKNNQRLQESFLTVHPPAALQNLASKAMINVHRISEDYERAANAPATQQLQPNYEAALRNGLLFGPEGLKAANNCERAIQDYQTMQAQRLTDIGLYREFARRVNPELLQPTTE